MKKNIRITLLIWLMGLLFIELPISAHSMGNADIYISADGEAFTTNVGDHATQWYDKGYTVQTGVTGGLPALNIGEHYYSVERKGLIPVEKWMVDWPKGHCQHDSYPEGTLYHGESFGRSKCGENYYSGWLAYCADCKEEVVHGYFYMSQETAKSITSLDMSKDYYYKCPHCSNLEQAMVLRCHICKAVSPNRYFVRYHANFGSGHMEKSIHMVNNSTIYEGCEVTPQKHLTLNTYTRKGYEFLGWNTKKDGSGTVYADGAEIYNLSMEENSTVILYAQWKKTSSILEIDPAGGKYQGETDNYHISGEYGTSYIIDISKLMPANGYQVSFDTMGGAPIADALAAQSFIEWSCCQPFHGILQGNKYTYMGPDGGVDRVTAVYRPNSIILPEAVRTGYSFGGWFADRECTIPVGSAGSSIIPSANMTLYAAWVDLQLVSEDNYVANAGKGAVNLSWQQKDSQSKVYEVFQRKENLAWNKINAIKEESDSFQFSKTIQFSGEEGSYTIPASGFYELTLTGAQGGNYNTHQGGLGGEIKATIYLEKGEKLQYVIGGQNGYPGGGSATLYGNGGGYSKVSVERLGELLIVGGGGGANQWENGGAGGSSEQVLDRKQGQTGASGGGGGYLGGISGIVNTHTHLAACKHVHVGNPNVYGGCYTKETVCGSTDISFRESYRVFYYGNIDDYGNHIFCVRCNSDECNGHNDIYGTYTCNVCGYTTEQYMSKCSAASKYELSCEAGDDYICGMEEGEVLSGTSAYGGSNYVNVDACIDYQETIGVQKGDGILQIVSKQIGLLDAQELKGVIAADEAAPEKIDESSIVKTAVTESGIRVAFKRPKDRGTTYYHQVKSYEKTTMNFMCESNVTKNTLVSQIMGYRYKLDSEPTTEVGTEDAFYAEKGEAPFLLAQIEDTVKYLHVAAQDKAGNLGDTIHIKISEEDQVYWPVITEKLKLESGKHIYPAASADTYYVRADDSTPIHLIWEGLLCGSARKDYQINEAHFVVTQKEGTSVNGSFSVIVPNRENGLTGSFTYSAEQLHKRQSGILGLQDASYTLAKRYQQCKSLLVNQKFTISEIYDGKNLCVMPRAAVVGEKTIVSEEGKDLQNSIYLIADGSAPVLAGIDALKNLDKLDLGERKEAKIILTAVDSGSGLSQFWVEIKNQDNGMIRTYIDNTLSGKIELTIQKEDDLFQGKCSVVIQAVDNVGNQNVQYNEVLGVGLEAYVERILEPHTPVFKKGESGVLHIKTWGYVERLEISFPTVFVQQDATLQRVITYSVPKNSQTEEIPFMVPLNVPEGEMTILVKAYKAGTQLDAEPEFITIKVQGDILDEIRTRLR